MTKPIVILSFVLCSAIDFCFSQQLQKQIKPEKYRAVHWSQKQKLPGNSVHTMIKDVKGFLWIGANNSLCRFDGAVFRKYKPDNQKDGAINSNKIYSFEEDSLHNIWIETDKGVSRYDMKADTFTNFSSSAQLRIGPFWSTRDEMYCIGPGSVITIFNIHTLERKEIPVSNKIDLNLWGRWNVNKCFFDKGSQSIWKLSWYPEENVIEQVFLNNGESRRYRWRCYRPNSGTHRHDAEDMQYDLGRNSIWINSGDGLLQFTLSDKQFHLAEPFKELVKSKEYDRDVGVDIDKNGRIWFSTRRSPAAESFNLALVGIFIYDPETNEIEPVFSDAYLQKKAGENNLHIYCDPDGIVWTSDYMTNGIYELIQSTPSIKRFNANPKKKDSLSSGLVSTIVSGPGGKLWLGTADGINIFDPVTETFEVLRQTDLPGIKGTAIIPLHIDTLRQIAWINAGSQADYYTYFGMTMYEMDLRTYKCRRIVFKEASEQIDRFAMAHTLARPYKNGLLFPIENHGIFYVEPGGEAARLMVPILTGFGAFEVADDRYLFSQRGGGNPNPTYEHKNGTWVKIPHPLDSLQWFSMIHDKKHQTFWLSSSDKLTHYTKDFNEIKSYDEADGYSGVMINMQFDNDGNIWFIDLVGQFGRFNPTTGLFTFFSQSDGYYERDYFWFAPITKGASGDLYTGIGWKTGTHERDWGFDRIDPKKYSAINSVRVYMSSITVNQKPFTLSTGINSLDNLNLPYNQNTIRIEAGVINFYTKAKSQLRYKLEKNGEEGEWTYPADFAIRLDDLRPDSYRLMMQASNASSEFIGPEKILNIDISPPVWDTWWFRVLAFVFVVDLIYTIVRWRFRQKFKLQIERSENKTQMAEMRQKTAELSQQKTEVEMQALRAQMNPHFIFNSLNSINRFILQNNRAQASEYLTKFSKLVRMILQNSQASLISLESELESLNLYLDLEAVRFEHRFAYKISCPKDLDIEVLKVPPLVIQPFTENAIWHGLMHKEDKGQLDIHVSEEGDYLYVKITDNGIGRKKAGELASKSATKHKSMGLRITKDRIAMLQKTNGAESPVKIIDLEHDDGSAAGTEVIIKMPVIYE